MATSQTEIAETINGQFASARAWARGSPPTDQTQTCVSTTNPRQCSGIRFPVLASSQEISLNPGGFPAPTKPRTRRSPPTWLQHCRRTTVPLDEDRDLLLLDTGYHAETLCLKLTDARFHNFDHGLTMIYLQVISVADGFGFVASISGSVRGDAFVLFPSSASIWVVLIRHSNRCLRQKVGAFRFKRRGRRAGMS